MTRLFVAVRPPERARRELLTAVAPLRAGRRRPGLRWSDPDDWHLTLAFLGEVAGERWPGLAGRLARVASGSRRFDLRIAGSGHFGDRVLWAGVSGDLDRLHGLADSTCAAIGDARPAYDLRPFVPHLTIAYAPRRQGATNGTGAASCRPAMAPDLRPVFDALADFRGVSWSADRLLLMSADPRRSPRYAIEEGWSLPE